MIQIASDPLKIVMLGEGRVGKTSLTLQFVKNEFNQGEESTCNANFLEKSVYVQGDQVDLTIWDTAGQEKFRALTPLYYRDCAGCFQYIINLKYQIGAVLVYDLTYRESFDRIQDWVQELKLHSQQSQTPIEIVLAGNKCDLPSQTYQISTENAEMYAYKIGATHILTSAKTGQGTQEVFQKLAQKIVYAKKGIAMNGIDRQRESVVITQKDFEKRKNSKQQKEKKSGCC